MPPKRRDKDNESKIQQQLRMEQQMPTDQELFLQAFEKPTQIYRYLRTRNLVSPCFLMRTLTYMNHRMSRTHEKRKDFKIDGMLERLISKSQEDDISPPETSSFMNLTFTGFHDKLYNGASGTDTVLVETILLKLYHKKRKDLSAPVMQIAMGQSQVVRNPDTANLPSTTSAISVPSASFHFNNGHLVKSYVLVFRVTIVQHGNNASCNGSHSDTDEPTVKRRKNGRTALEEEKLYGAELIIFDKHQHCLLTGGDYELVLQEVLLSKNSSKKQSTWESFDEGDKAMEQFDMFNWGPTLKFSLSWSNNMLNGTVPMPRPISSTTTPSPQVNCLNGSHGPDDITNISEQANGSGLEVLDKRKMRGRPRIFYQFLYNNNTRQQTESKDDLHCPWCAVNCVKLYSLIKHLKLSHGRFSFNYIPHPKGARIDVSINECYDGSYSGNPHDLHSCVPGFAFSRNGPVRRTPVTSVTVCHPQRPKHSLTEFLDGDDTEYDGVRPYVMGHNRLYHHTGTCLPVRPQEIDIDSEGENDPEWLRIKTKHMIDEFTDVNEGEKELMKLWNLHVMKFGFVGDCQIPLACRMFVERHGPEILQKNLYQNFVLHMCNLLDFGLINAAALYQAINQLSEKKDGVDGTASETAAATASKSTAKMACGPVSLRGGGREPGNFSSINGGPSRPADGEEGREIVIADAWSKLPSFSDGCCIQ